MKEWKEIKLEDIGNYYHISTECIHYIIYIMWSFFSFRRSDDQFQTLQHFDMVFLCGCGIDPCGVDAAVP